MRIFCRVKPCKEDKNLAISFPEKEKLNIQNIRQQTNDSIKKTEVQLRTIEIAIQNQNLCRLRVIHEYLFRLKYFVVS